MPLVPSHIKKLERYKPGKSVQLAKYKSNDESADYIKLSSNENPLEFSPMLVEVLKKTYHNVNRYPDASGIDLRKKLSQNFNVEIDNVVIGTIILFNIDEGIMIDGKIDLEKLNPIGRLVENWFNRPTNNFKIQRKIKPEK